MFYLRLLMLIFLSVFFLASCDNSRQTQNTSSEESILKNEPLETLSPAEKDSADLNKDGSAEKKIPLQSMSSEKKGDRAPGNTMSPDTVNATIIPDESGKETPRPGDVDEGETGSVSRFPENIEDYEPEDITEYPDKTPKNPSQDPEAPVTNTDQK